MFNYYEALKFRGLFHEFPHNKLRVLRVWLCNKVCFTPHKKFKMDCIVMNYLTNTTSTAYQFMKHI